MLGVMGTEQSPPYGASTLSIGRPRTLLFKLWRIKTTRRKRLVELLYAFHIFLHTLSIGRRWTPRAGLTVINRTFKLINTCALSDYESALYWGSALLSTRSY